jgi:uncharacterized Zn finger protein (UPF0148 family)
LIKYIGEKDQAMKGEDEIMAEYLLKGGKMLSKTCPACGCPLFEVKGDFAWSAEEQAERRVQRAGRGETGCIKKNWNDRKSRERNRIGPCRDTGRDPGGSRPPGEGRA